jgi:hypothetical protein
MGDLVLDAPTDTEEGAEEVIVAARRAKVRRSEPPQPAQPALGGNMERLGPESQALCQLLMGHISQKGAETTEKIDLLRGHLDSQIQRLDVKTDQLKTAAAEDSKEIRTLIKRNQEFSDARLAALEMAKGATGAGSTGGGSTTASLGSGNSVCLAASSQDDMYRPAPNRSCDGFPLPRERRTFYVGGFSFDSDGDRIKITIYAMIAAFGWLADTVAKVSASTMGSGGRIEMRSTKDMWDIMKSMKGNRKIDLAASAAGVLGGSYWFDIDAPRPERKWKRRFTGAVKTATKTYMSIHKVDNSVALPIFKPNWGSGVITYRNETGLNIRFIEPKGENGEFRATLASIPVLPGFDLNNFVNQINNGDFDNPPQMGVS